MEYELVHVQALTLEQQILLSSLFLLLQYSVIVGLAQP